MTPLAGAGRQGSDGRQSGLCSFLCAADLLSEQLTAYQPGHTLLGSVYGMWVSVRMTCM